MEFGAHLPLISFTAERRSLADLLAFTEAARDLGYRFLCANDHLTFQRPWLDGPTALAAVLERTGDMELATTVALPVVRGPAAIAKTLGALAVLSEGRLIVGVGPGSSEQDYAVAGLQFEERWRRLDEAVAAMREHWGEPPADRDHEFYAQGVALEPLPAVTPSIWIGSWGSPAGLRRVSRLGDGWLASAYNTTPDAFGEGWLGVRAAVAAQDRDPEAFPNGLATMWTYVTEDAAEAARIIDEIVVPMLNRDPALLREQLTIGSAEHCAALLRRYAEAGAQRVFIWPVADERTQLERFAREVVPLLEVTQ